MKKLFKLWIVVALLLMAGCNKDGDDIDDGNNASSEGTITIISAMTDFTAKGGSAVVTFDATAPWTARILNNRADSWCSVEPASGPMGKSSVTITTTANDTAYDRSATVVLNAGKSEYLRVSQKPEDALTITSSKFEIPVEGGEVVIEATANASIEYVIDEEAKSWITYEGTRAMTTSNLVFKIAPSDEEEVRTGVITVKCGSCSEDITIYQEGTKPAIVLSKNRINKSSHRHTAYIDVKSNVDVTVEIPSDIDWISEDTTKSTSTNRFYFEISENLDTENSRSAKINFANKEYGLTETLTIYQERKWTIMLDKTAYVLGTEGGRLEFDIQTNSTVKVRLSEGAESWISQVSTRALETRNLCFDVAKCSLNEIREGTITLLDGNANQHIITVKQMGTSYIDPELVPDDEIWYRTLDGKKYNTRYCERFTEQPFNAAIISHTYENGIGKIKCDGTITTINRYALSDPNSKLSELYLPKTTETINERGIYNAPNLTTLHIPQNLNFCRSINDGNMIQFTGHNVSEDGRCVIIDGTLAAFASKNITEYTTPAGVKQVYSTAFRNSPKLAEITLSEGVVSLRDKAFENCKSLRVVTLPSTLKNIDHTTFDGCDNLEAVYGDVTSEDHSCIVSGKKLVLYAIKKGPKDYRIPDNITQIAEFAFHSANLETITMGDQVIRIGGYAFSDCQSLKSVTISANTKEIEWGHYNPFHWCLNLETIYLRAPIPPRWFSACYCNYPNNLSVFVPKGSLSLYQNSAWYNEFGPYMKGYEFENLPAIDTDKYYISTDFSQDGTVVKLQTATKGNGIEIVLMGDKYSDRQIADGTYRADMEAMYNAFFTREPFKSFREFFNVSYVNVVSLIEGQTSKLSAIIGSDGVSVDKEACIKYTLNAVPEEKMDNTVVAVYVTNSEWPGLFSRGTCTMYDPEDLSDDYGSGFSIAKVYCAVSELDYYITHEACGHGFGKLQDEYVWRDYLCRSKAFHHDWGWSKNVDITDDPASICWSHFLSDARYANEVGIYEGGALWEEGVWRPSRNSVMNEDEAGNFNAPSREAIYYRIHKLAYGESWEYNYEEFVEWDARNRTATATTNTLSCEPMIYNNDARHCPPVIVNKSWREFVK